MNKVSMKIALGLLFSIALIGCKANQSSTETATVSMQMGTYTTAQSFWLDLLLPKAHASVSDLKFCFKRLRFKTALEDTASPETSEDNIDFNLGEVTIDSQGTYLSDIVVPKGIYKRVEFDLESDCLSGNSVQLVNNNGGFSSSDRITIKYEGELVIDGDGTLTLDTQPILDAMNNYNGSGSSIKDTLEAVTGTL